PPRLHRHHRAISQELLSIPRLMGNVHPAAEQFLEQDLPIAACVDCRFSLPLKAPQYMYWLVGDQAMAAYCANTRLFYTRVTVFAHQSKDGYASGERHNENEHGAPIFQQRFVRSVSGHSCT